MLKVLNKTIQSASAKVSVENEGGGTLSPTDPPSLDALITLNIESGVVSDKKDAFIYLTYSEVTQLIADLQAVMADEKARLA